MDKPIRVLVANRPKLMRDLILATLADEPGIEIVGEVSDEMEIAGEVQRTLLRTIRCAMSPIRHSGASVDVMEYRFPQSILY